MVEAGKRKSKDDSGYIGGTLKKYATGFEGIGLGNIMQLGNAYITAAQRDVRARGRSAEEVRASLPHIAVMRWRSELYEFYLLRL